MRELYLEVFIAIRYLRGQGRTIIFGSGIRLSFLFLSLMVYILALVLSVFNGFQEEIHQLLARSANHITITPGNPRYPIANQKEILANYSKDPDIQRAVRAVYPGISVNALLEIKNRFEGKTIRAVPLLPETKPADGKVSGNKKSEFDIKRMGYFPRLVHYDLKYMRKFQGGRYILVGRALARKEGWKIGTSVRIILPRGGSLSRSGLQAQQGYFTIAGFFRTGFNEFDGSLVYMSLKSAQRLIGLRGKVNEIIVQLHDLADLDHIRRVVQKKDYLGHDNYFLTSTIREERGNFLAAVKLEKTLMMIVLGLLIIAGVAGIWVTIYLLVKEKTRSIGMLRAMGLPMRSINIIFTANAMLIGLISTALGGMLTIYVADRFAGFLKLIENFANTVWSDNVCRWFLDACGPVQIVPDNIYYFDYLPVQADLNIIFGVAIVTLILSGIAGYIPSRRAARVDPAHAIREE